MRHIYFNLTILFSLAAISCSSGGDDPIVEAKPPAIATLVFPNENSECTEGTNFTTTESDVLFNWGDSEHATTYKLFVKNLDTQVTKEYASPISEMSITVLRGTPYSWYVISQNSNLESAKSTIWKFYNAGIAVSSYAPFPAELIDPKMGVSQNSSTTSVLLNWEGNDVDDDITDYEVLFGTNNPPLNSQGNSTDSEFVVNVTSGNTYYWRVITNDSQGNNSESEVFQFKVN